MRSNADKPTRIPRTGSELLEEAGEVIDQLLEAIQDMRRGHNASIESAYERAEEFLDDHGLN